MDDWILNVVTILGEAGIGLLMFAEAIVLPLPSELVMPLAGYLSARGQMNFWGATVAGTIGSMAGALLWYGIGRRIGRMQRHKWTARYGRWLALEEADLEAAQRFFTRHGRLSVFLGRMVPLVRVLISIPAGFSRMSMNTFLAFSAAGTFLWNLLLAWAGQQLGLRLGWLQDYIGLITWCVAGAAALWYVLRLMRQRRSGL